MQYTRTTKAFWRLACALAWAVACALVVAFGAAGAAFGADAACFEGESMSDSSTAIAAVSDANASGRCPTGGNKAVAYVQTNETTSKSVSFSSVAEKVEIRVRGADTGGAVTLPRVRVFIDGEDYANNAILDRQVTSSYATFTADLTRSADRAAGTHTVYVKMRNWDTGDKISVDWTAFTYAPAANTKPPSAPTITSPSTNGTTDTDGDLSFSFTGAEAGGSYECSLDQGTASYSSCTSPKTYAAQANGSYTFRVRQIDRANNKGTAATRTITVNVPAADKDGDGVADGSDSCPNDAGPSSNQGCPITTVYEDVTDYGATAGDASDDSQEFNAAMAAAGPGERVYVPKGVGAYRLYNVTLPSDTYIDVEAGAVLKKFGTSNGTVFSMQGSQTVFSHNNSIQGVGGKFHLDLSDANDGSTGMRLRNVENFQIKNMDCTLRNSNPNVTGNVNNVCIGFLSWSSTPVNGVYQAPKNGLIENAHTFDAGYGWGLTQFNGGQDITLKDISSEGGVTLRLENYKQNVTPMRNIVADGVTCTDGHAAVMFNPHGFTHPGPFTITNVTANSCEEGVQVGGNATDGGSYGLDASVDGLSVVPGNTAQVHSAGLPLGAWVEGPSRYCVQDFAPTYNIPVTNKSCGGLIP